MNIKQKPKLHDFFEALDKYLDENPHQRAGQGTWNLAHDWFGKEIDHLRGSNGCFYQDEKIPEFMEAINHLFG